MSSVYKRIDDNITKTIIFLAIFAIFFIGVVYLADIFFLNNHLFIGAALVFLAIFTAFNYFHYDKVILKKNKAVLLSHESNEELYDSIDNLSITAGLPMPKIYSMADSAINAFTVGRNPRHASLVFTAGALEKLSKAEMEGVIAHEMAHIENRDILFSTTLAFFLGLVRQIVDFTKSIYNSIIDFINSSGSMAGIFILVFFYGFFIFLSLIMLALLCIPVIEEIIFYSISRKREFLADAESALLTRYPKGLISALKKISMDPEVLGTVDSSTAHLYISSPFKDKVKGFLSGLFHSHPSLEERIIALEKMDRYGSSRGL